MQAQMSEGGAINAETVSVEFGPRFVAFLIDALIVGIPVGIVAAVLVGIGLPMPLLWLLEVAAGVGYQVYFWTTTGQTIGKQVIGLKVVSADTGELLEYSGAFLRYGGYIVSSLLFGLGYLWVIWDPHHDGWHDKIAKTKVIRVEK